MSEGPQIDWLHVYSESKTGYLMNVLKKLPQIHWTAKDEHGWTLLHYACLGPNVAAAATLLKYNSCDANARDNKRDTPAHVAAKYAQSRLIEILCTAGANMRAFARENITPLDCALFNSCDDNGTTVRMLLANRIRLDPVDPICRRFVTTYMRLFERSVLRCRSAVVAMLHVKRAGKLYRWDKFLLREMAFAIWATRHFDWNEKTFH